MDTLPPTGDLADIVGSSSYGATFEPRPGMVLADRYALVEPIGRGASGWVWKARHTIIGKPFAIKLLITRTGSTDEAAQAAAIRMLREANTLSRVQHPNVIAVTDFGHARPGGTPFIVMELLEGEPLRAVLDARRLSWQQARVWGVQMLEGVEAAHEEGIVHRDLKPANLFVTRKDDRIKVLDFGIAHNVASQQGDPDVDRRTGRLELRAVFGTPTTMSPEQIAGGEVDIRSDIYALGCVLYEMIAGRPPVHGDPAEILYQHVYVDPTPLRALAGPEVPDDVCAVVDRCLRKDPMERPASVSEVREVFDLRKVKRPAADAEAVVLEPARAPQHDPPPAPARWRRAAAGALVAASALFGLVAAGRPAPAVPLRSVAIEVPAPASIAVGVPSLHAELPVLEQAQPKHALRPERTAEPQAHPSSRRSTRASRPKPRQPVAQASAPPRPVAVSNGPKVAADARVPELKNPFGN